MWSIIFLSLIVLCGAQDIDDGTPTPIMPTVDPGVSISQGQVMGIVAEDGDYFEFHGIPYADSTSGSNRFKAPSSPPSFEELFVADRKNIKCVRALGTGYEGTEDCLVANVFTPTLTNTANLPVMVWIKGKEFDQTFAPEYSFKHLVEKEVVVVSLNFRESILGFLCLGTETAPGNAGLKDIIAGLRWVQENIAQFGGDPNNIVLFGHGSGAAAVDLVTLSPMSTGLVHKAIAQSGSAIAPWAVTRDNLEYAIQVAEALGHTVSSIEQLSEIFTRTSVAALMAIINELDLTDNSLAFAPCVEREGLQGIEPFLIKSPHQTIVDGDFAQIPFMTGFVDVEGSIRAEEAVIANWLERMETSFEEFIQPDLEFDSEEERATVAEAIRSFYFDNQYVTLDEYLEYHGDTMMIVSAIREAQLRAAVSNSSIYLYQFSYKGSLGDSFVPGPLILEKAAHSEDLAYLFYGNDMDENVPELDFAVSDILIERWTNFAKTGNPTSEISHVTWEPFTATDGNYLRILDDDEVIEGTLEVELQNPHNEIVSFWNIIYETHFLDAEGKWELSERNDEDDDGEVAIDSGEEDSSGEEDTNEEEGDSDDGEPDSASTAVGYTFVIITLFGILNQFHWSQILS